MQRFREESGSAVVEFVLVMIPFILLAGAQLAWLGDSIERTELRAVAIDAARFGALADVTQAEALASLQQKLLGYSGSDGSLSKTGMVAVTILFPSHQWWLPGVRLSISSFAVAELDPSQ